jgi:hypothetical protein
MKHVVLLVVSFMFMSCSDNLSKMNKFRDKLSKDKNYTFKLLKLSSNPVVERQSGGKILSKVSLKPEGQMGGIVRDFFCECDLSDYEMFDHINIDTKGYIIESHGRPFPFMWFFVKLVRFTGAGIPYAYPIGQFLYGLFFLIMGLGGLAQIFGGD